MARALARLGFPVTIYVEAEPLPITQELVALTDTAIAVALLERSGPQHERLAQAPVSLVDYVNFAYQRRYHRRDRNPTSSGSTRLPTTTDTGS